MKSKPRQTKQLDIQKEQSHLGASGASGILYVVATPIGNLEDITLRALRILKEAALVAAEDTRVTAKLLKLIDIKTRVIGFRDQNARVSIPKILSCLRSGQNVALVTDAGTPAISDPGDLLVQAVLAENITVSPIPGPSALAAALSVAALQGDGIRFLGFLPRSGKERQNRLNAIAQDPSSTVLYESPNRIGKTLADLVRACDKEPPRQAVVMRELTKVHEEIVHGNLSELCDTFSGKVKGEIVLVVSGWQGTAKEMSSDEIFELVKSEIAKGASAKDVARNLSAALGVKRKQVYEMAVQIITANRSKW